MSSSDHQQTHTICAQDLMPPAGFIEFTDSRLLHASVEQLRETGQHGVVPVALIARRSGRAAIGPLAVSRRVRAVLVGLSFAALITACSATETLPERSPESGPTFVDETAAAELLTAITVPVEGGAPVVVRIGPRPSGEPGMCVDSLLFSRGRVQCLVLGSAGKLFSPIETSRSGLRVNLLVHPDVAEVRVTIASKATDLILIDVPGVAGARVFAYEAHQMAAPPLRFFDARGQEIDDWLMIEYRHWN